MRIGIIGKFDNIWDEEYIAVSFEMLGHTVIRINQIQDTLLIKQKAILSRLDILLFTKWNEFAVMKEIEKTCPNLITVCWVFDLYFDYDRERLVKYSSYFKAQYVFTTDAGHDIRWKELGINHNCVRQGIYKDQCFLEEGTPEGIVFVGSENPYYPKRTQTVLSLAKEFPLKWYGKQFTNELRGPKLNKVYANAKIVIGDSYYSPYYWSNRVVETLGRGGFLIHQEVEGLQEAYPYLVTYKRGDKKDLKDKIKYYLEHENERLEIVRKNYEWVRNNYTMEKQCQKLLNFIKK